MNKTKKCSSCYFCKKDVQIDMGAHSDICLFFETLLGSYRGILDGNMTEERECDVYLNKKDVFNKLFDLQLYELKEPLHVQLKDDNSEVISRDELYENVNRIFGSVDKFLDIVEEDRPCCYVSIKDEDEYLVIDSRAHRYISWYKHVGRDFDTDMETKEEVISFLERLYNNWKKEYEEEGKQ